MNARVKRSCLSGQPGAQIVHLHAIKPDKSLLYSSGIRSRKTLKQPLAFNEILSYEALSMRQSLEEMSDHWKIYTENPLKSSFIEEFAM